MKKIISVFVLLLVLSCCPTKKVSKERKIESSLSDSLIKKEVKQRDLVINTNLVSHREVVSEQMITAYCNEKGEVVVNESSISSGDNKASVSLVENGFMLRLELGAYEEKNRELISEKKSLDSIVSLQNKEIKDLKSKEVQKTKYPSFFWYLLLVLSVSVYLNIKLLPFAKIKKKVLSLFRMV